MLQLEDMKSKDPVILLLEQVRKTNDRGMNAVIPVRSFVELESFGYVTGTSSSVQLTTSGRKTLMESEK